MHHLKTLPHFNIYVFSTILIKLQRSTSLILSKQFHVNYLFHFHLSIVCFIFLFFVPQIDLHCVRLEECPSCTPPLPAPTLLDKGEPIANLGLKGGQSILEASSEYVEARGGITR